MRSARSRIGLAVLLTIGTLTVAAAPSPAAKKPPGKEKANSPAMVAEFQQLHRKLTRMSTEKVWSIPWQLSVRKARELAAEQNKPVFLWISSNGGTHPLGPC